MNKDGNRLLLVVGIVTVLLLGSLFVMRDHSDVVNSNDMSLGNDVREEDTVIEKHSQPEESTSSNEDDIQEVEEETLSVDSARALIIGLDASRTLTDVLMVVDFNAETNDVKIISIPRDLEIDYSEEPFRTMRLEFNEKVRNGEIEADLHQRAYSKINAIYLDTGMTQASLYYTREVVEEVTGVDIDYVASVDVYNFQDVVDAVGGVEFDVPQDMYWKDPVQDLLIDVKEGLQVLDGNQAMGVVRYRHDYLTGDLQRIQVQQDFMIAFFEQVIANRDSNQILDLVDELFAMVEADFGLAVAMDYANYLLEMDLQGLLAEENMITVPTWGERLEYEVDGVVKWHQLWDPAKVREAVDELLDSGVVTQVEEGPKG